MPYPEQPQLNALWHEAQFELRKLVGDSTFSVWLADISIRASEDILLLELEERKVDWVSKRYGSLIRAVIAKAFGEQASVSITGVTKKESSISRVNSSAGSAFNPKYTFDGFVIGNGNHLAHSSALAVAEMPGQAYNPLFIYGPPGLGKTHLLHSIANYIRQNTPEINVRYSTTEAFTNNFVRSLRSGNADEFKNLYRSNDVLLIDDIQFLQSKAKTEEEFFHTFNALYETGAQLVLTCDRMPSDLASLERRLLERFESGLVTSIEKPDFQTRLTILRIIAARERLVMSDESCLAVIASRITESVRALEGALIRVVAYHSLTNKPIDEQLISRVLDDLYPETKVSETCSIVRIKELMCQFFSLESTELESSSRTARVSWPRHLAIYLAREFTDASLPEIGAAFGGRNHSTVIHSHRTAAKKISQDPQLRLLVNNLSIQLGVASRPPLLTDSSSG